MAQIDHRTRSIVEALRGLPERALLGPSLLPGWSRLTIACHLRYGAEALHRMTVDTRAARPASYYPGGRAEQRPATLEPAPGEAPQEVVEGLAAAGEGLTGAWVALGDGDWDLVVREPDGETDLGPLPLGRFPLLRLTEVEVHGSDLDVGLEDWSEVFVATALPFRIGWLAVRRTNHREADRSLQGSWLLDATDGPAHLVSVDGDHVETRPAERGERATATITAASRDLLALLLGRPRRGPVERAGDAAFGAAFERAFPGP